MGAMNSKSTRPEMTVSKARQLIREAGLRCTSCRVAVLQHVATATTPVSHADVADELVPRGFDKSTIFRCLTEFAESGFLVRLELGDHVWRFELRDDDQQEGAEHPHFLCLDCGTVRCLPEIQVKLTGNKGHKSKPRVNVTEILLKGYCDGCS